MQMKSETNKENNNKKQKSQEVKRKGEGERQYVVSAKVRARPHRRRFTCVCVCVCVCVKDNAPENARKEAAALYAANKTGETMSLGVANTVSLYQAPRIPKSQVQ